MRKLLLTFVLAVTASNLAIGAYAAVCESRGGAKSCGTECTALADGACRCTGACSKEERDWMTGGGGGPATEELLAE